MTLGEVWRNRLPKGEPEEIVQEIRLTKELLATPGFLETLADRIIRSMQTNWIDPKTAEILMSTPGQNTYPAEQGYIAVKWRGKGYHVTP